MAKIDIDRYIEDSGIRKARFGGYEPEDVRRLLQDLCNDYEQSLSAASTEARAARQESDALRRRCQTLLVQNQNLSAQNATLAGQADKLAGYRSDLEGRCSALREQNHSLTDQLAVARLKNRDLVRANQELSDRAEEARDELRVKGREHDEAKQQVLAERDKVIADAETEAARIRQQAKDDADKVLKDTNLKAEAIDQLAREQAIAQARKMVQSATDETREIQNTHRLRLQDLKNSIEEMEKSRDSMLQYLTKMIGELQKAQALAEDSDPMPEHGENLPDPSSEPELDLSAHAVDAAASTLREIQPEPETVPAVPRPAVNRVVAPGLDEAVPTANTVVTPSPEYFDAAPKPQPGDPQPKPFQKQVEKQPKEQKEQEVEIPGAIFSYPILRQRGEPILDEEPPLNAPHTPVMPDLSDDDEENTAPVLPTPKPDLRRRKAVAALRSLQRRLNRTGGTL